jgi:predicted DNA-binding protein (MmcQ/YjbR family)
MPEARLRTLCLGLPEAEERETWNMPTFRVRGRIYAMAQRRDGPAVWVKAPPVSQAMLLEADPRRFSAPPYPGPKGWAGIRLSGKPDWAEVAALVRRSYSLATPRRLAALVPEDG